MQIIFPDKNSILYTQEKSEILENIIRIGCWIELFCDVYYIFADRGASAPRRNQNKKIAKTPRSRKQSLNSDKCSTL